MGSGLKRAAAATACSVVMVSLGLTGAHGGETTGNGKRIFEPGQLPAKSICAYSGQNDEYHEEGTDHPRVQSFGQVVKAVGPLGGVPGTACNPSGG